MAPSWVAGITRVTGDVVSAADWNQYLGVDGSLDYLGSVHAHEAGAGEGSTLALKAVLGVGIHALGCMQGVGVNVLRFEYITGEAEFNNDTQTVTGTWANPFTTGAILFVACSPRGDAGDATRVSHMGAKGQGVATATLSITVVGVGTAYVDFIGIGYD